MRSGAMSTVMGYLDQGKLASLLAQEKTARVMRAGGDPNIQAYFLDDEFVPVAAASILCRFERQELAAPPPPPSPRRH
jgi:hypothetical protein